ncbi:MAG: toll/interleukin-1 receptor domain-containing protein [Phycisphaerae bacterium]|nr:toll/interleukin-1 receptor domain-containing protein [Saprospiraceae bacterium]
MKIFISYSKHDLAHKDTLLKHLSGLRDRIITWHDRDILAGEDWDKSIKTALMEADVVLYLVTHHSIATEYIYQVELPLIAQRCEDKQCRLIPVIVDYCDWTELDFAKFNALPEKGISITDKKWVNENEAWLKVVEGVKAILKEMN